MLARKQALLKRHRRNKRIGVVIALIVIVSVGLELSFCLDPILLLLAWIAHEAWFADHLFYSPRDDYHYEFPPTAEVSAGRIEGDYLWLGGDFSTFDTLILRVQAKSTWFGRWFDPYVQIGADRQYLERGVDGQRYLNLSGKGHLVGSGKLLIRGHHCHVSGQVSLYAMRNPDYSQQRVLVIAPHADDAELAAFGLYSQAKDASIITITQGEIEASSYESLGLDKASAACFKGRLRAWSSIAVPLWGGVPQRQCVQLGYYCLQLPSMQAQPEQALGSRESGQADIRSVRWANPLQLPGDSDGVPSWHNLVADLVAVLEHYQPDVVVTPHPDLDPHGDHVASTYALLEALAQSSVKVKTMLMYANHLHDNDRWPMGPAGCGIALPPAIEPLPADQLWCPTLTSAKQLDKAMAMAMQPDLQRPLNLKHRVRRLIQHYLAGRRWPRTGADEFFRKAVRRHELFWVRNLNQ
ncbi:PIG-L deacetylase family protein [Pseudomonas sp. 5P_3.1_Bac2]|uniref:PIG-L deacetylase family protein n=1 Tax=Pseudomonas sp. 5P_3.1_Bac2 TaxID=2971617 RepID=UPI0021CA4E7F|nr:PIG-L family deacetylase [Pseudomonas sp. 5P_3.1_Bac2]MCU1718328.1 PIG-L family deacetylase [Pseudomonas sp. 5P_3.1_Bac2]